MEKKLSLDDIAEQLFRHGKEKIERKSQGETQERYRITRLKQLLAKLVEYNMEGLILYRPLEPAARFHKSDAPIRLLDASNQSGKTLAAAVENARAWTGTDPYGKYPKENGSALLVGYDGDHLADPMWQKVGEPGAFATIRDEITGMVRAVRPDPKDPRKLDPYDEAYREKWLEAPPLLPPRMIKSIAWEDRSKNIPRVIETINGWKILWRSSKGDATRGIQIHQWNFDEEILNDKFLPETLRGCMRYGGIGFWSATPQSGGPQLYSLRDRFEGGDEDVQAFSFFLEDNPYYTAEQKRIFYDSLSEEEREVRYFGKYALAGRRVYPMYDPMGIHGCEPFDLPREWTIYGILDPGRQYCGTLLIAVDPEEKHAYVWRGFVQRNSDANRWADLIRETLMGYRVQAWVIDKRMGRQRSVGYSETTAKQYWEALEAAGCLPRRRGPLDGFYPGEDDVMAREEALLGWMRIRHTGPFIGTPFLQVMRGNVRDLDSQLKRAHYDVERPDKRVELKGADDLCDCAEYAAAFRGLRYVEPDAVEDIEIGDPLFDSLITEKLARIRRTRQQHQSEGHVLG